MNLSLLCGVRRHPVAAALLMLAGWLTLVAGNPAAAQPAPRKPAAAPARRAPPSPPPPPPLAPAGGEQLAAAALAHFGRYDCEFNETVSVDINRQVDGYVDVKHGKSLWTMKPVLSSTGALRLEDVRGRMLMLQIADKSMLMDTQVGRRLVDNCVHEKQREAIRQGLQRESIGIDPARAASASASASAPAPAPAPAPASAADPGASAAQPPAPAASQ